MSPHKRKVREVDLRDLGGLGIGPPLAQIRVRDPALDDFEVVDAIVADNF